MLGRRLKLMKVSIEQLEFPSSVKDKILKLKDISKINTEFIGGKYIHFENTNLSIALTIHVCEKLRPKVD